MISFELVSHALTSFLESEAGINVTKIYIKGQNISFDKDCIQRFGSAEGMKFYVDSMKNSRDLMEALNVTTIQSIEALENRIRNLENNSKGIVTIRSDEGGRIGLHIPGVLKIDNQPLAEDGTNFNLILEKHIDIYRKKEEQ